MQPDRLDGVAWREVVDITRDVATTRSDRLAEEVPLEVRCNGEPLAVMMVTPCDLEDFARGFALTELGVAGDGLSSVKVQALLEGIAVDIHTFEPLTARPERWMPGRSGCGICGNRSLEDVIRHPDRVGQGIAIASASLDVARTALHLHQPLNAITGALHAAAWAMADGSLRLVREDVGRHNALDKLIGGMLHEGIDAASGFAVVTSRASYEMVAKAAAAGMPLLAAISAPTALAVDLADSCGLTLVGFLRSDRHVIYSHASRLANDRGA
ncbi:formate dehydrogenase accessory sulfurtransferase FdhD [Pseudoxanthomonas sp. PXM02]|uniref:formate dehydrogenase accessory sulfurtransferase FdhD n=1 Tax=Pseudoxanthomonas sp. PXM02 TaxID=2769294 RepID=UPI0017855206|nr:formate dehydrogenase accessory sulfurtransferase FdhD [Pseudoxanthomonas sp. PXM02]MBD9477451.1 formate dehydrogenase accessory sulfurtransferase FdhD [Pseudoxanthomonas sp. PXM02]